MELTAEQSTLGRALRLVARMTPTRPINPVHQLVLLDAEPGLLQLTATDGDLGAVVRTPADVTAPGRAGIPARLLADYVAQLPPGPIEIGVAADGKRVRASSGRFVSEFAMTAPDRFPALPPSDENAALEVDAARLRQAIDRVAFAAARDDQRPVLSAVMFNLDAEGLTLAAADGFRLARARLAEVSGSPRQFLIPVRAVAEFGRILDPAAETASVVPTTDGRGVYLAAKDTTLFVQLKQGTFPEIERVIPKEWHTRITVETAELRKAVRVGSLFGTVGVCPVILRPSDGMLLVEAQDDETGEWHSEIEASPEGEPQAVGLNALLLREVLDAVRSSIIELNWISSQSPVVIREARDANDADLCLVMPLYIPSLIRQAEAAGGSPAADKDSAA